MKVDQKREKKINIKMLWPFIGLAIVPIIVWGHIFKTDLTNYFWFSAQTEQSDLFLYGKMWGVIAVAAVMAVMLILTKRKQKNYQYSTKKNAYSKTDKLQWLPIIGYLLLVFLSVCASEHSKIGFFGEYEQFETIFAVASYAMIAYYAYNVIETKEDAMFVIDCQAASAAVVSLLGILQMFGVNYLQTSFMENLMSIMVGRTVTLGAMEGTNYSTLGNTNYTGVYSLFLIIVFLGVIFESTCKKRKLLYGIDLILLVIMLAGSQALTSVLAVIPVVVIAIVLQRKALKSHKKQAIIAAIVLIGILFALLVTKGEYFRDKIRYNFFAEKVTGSYDRDIVTKEGSVAYRVGDNWLNLSIGVNAKNYVLELKVTDQNGANVAIEQETENIIRLLEEKYDEIEVEYGYFDSGYYGFVIHDGDYNFAFLDIDGQYGYYYRNVVADLDTTKIERIQVMDGYEKFASGRGYIWSRTIPLLKYHLLLGSGRDTFVYEFPNDDVLGKANLNAGGNVVTRPHNIYLQMMVQDGVLGTLLCMFAGLYYLWRFIKMKKLREDAMQFAVFLAVFAYGCMGGGNDSLVIVTPLVWMMMGIGIKGVTKAEQGDRL